MRNIEEVRTLIEKTREELNALITTEKLEEYYEKSKELDLLIEEYIDLDDSIYEDEE